MVATVIQCHIFFLWFRVCSTCWLIVWSFVFSVIVNPDYSLTQTEKDFALLWRLFCPWCSTRSQDTDEAFIFLFIIFQKKKFYRFKRVNAMKFKHQHIIFQQFVRDFSVEKICLHPMWETMSQDWEHLVTIDSFHIELQLVFTLHPYHAVF